MAQLAEAEAIEDIKTKSRLGHVEAAAYLGISERTLYNWNYQGKGPRRSVGLIGELEYLRSDLDAFRVKKRRVIAAGAK